MQLPVSGIEVQFRLPTGNDDMALLEAGGGAVERALTVLPRLAQMSMSDSRKSDAKHHGTAWPNVTLTDFDVALLGLRRFLFGDCIDCVFRCASQTCGERVQTEVSVTALLGDIAPGTPPWAAPSRKRKGWFELLGVRDCDMLFRLPTVEDQVGVIRQRHAYKLLVQRCVDANHARARELGRVERAMELMAPLVSRTLVGSCPKCGASVSMMLHVASLVIAELSYAAAAVYEELDAIAETYHWDESTILAMPQSRRHAYAETIRRHDGAAV